MSLYGHRLKSGSKSVGLDHNRTWTWSVSWTQRDQNRTLVDGPQMLCSPLSLPIKEGVWDAQKDTVRHFHVLETLAPIQSSRRTGPSSPPPVLLLRRVDTGRGAVRSALRRSRDWIGSWDGTDSTRFIHNLHLRI